MLSARYSESASSWLLSERHTLSRFFKTQALRQPTRSNHKDV
jgi:hypothetical protein